MQKIYYCWIGFIVLLLSNLQVSSQNPKGRIVSAKGDNIYSNTTLICKALGLDEMVKPGMKVGILVNSDFEIRGAYANPDVTLAVVKMIIDAGAKEVVALQHIKQEYWERSSLYEEHREVLKKVRSIEQNNFPSVYDSLFFVKMDSFPGAANLKNLEIVKEVFDVDLFINIPIAKHHATTILTNAMKNLMGLNTRSFNVTFHLNPDFLAICIAEMGLIRKPDLIVSDATEVIVTNGPSGPGEMVKPMAVVASNDPVAIDAYCSGLIGFEPERVLTIQKGYDLGLGEMDLEKVKIEEIVQ